MSAACGLGDQRLGLGARGRRELSAVLKLRERGLGRVDAQVELAELEERLRVAGLAGGRVGQSRACRDQVVQRDVCGRQVPQRLHGGQVQRDRLVELGHRRAAAGRSAGRTRPAAATSPGWTAGDRWRARGRRARRPRSPVATWISDSSHSASADTGSADTAVCASASAALGPAGEQLRDRRGVGIRRAQRLPHDPDRADRDRAIASDDARGGRRLRQPLARAVADRLAQRAAPGQPAGARERGNRHAREEPRPVDRRVDAERDHDGEHRDQPGLLGGAADRPAARAGLACQGRGCGRRR